MGGYLTSHVLDLVDGKPAAGVRIELWRLDVERGARTMLASTRTNADGRTETPLLAGDEFVAGAYELVFDVGAYFTGRGSVTTMPFLSEVPVRFGIADQEAHYHVPLLVSPWAYSTYRGS